MKRMILMRHGDAPRSMDGEDERILSANGRLGVGKTAHYIKNHYKIEYILCSTAKRNRQTLDIIQEIIEENIPIDFRDEIYQNDTETLQELMKDCEKPAETILLLGHNPSLLTFALACDKDGYHEWIDELNQGFIPAEIIVIEFSGASSWKKAMFSQGKIKDIFIPK